MEPIIGQKRVITTAAQFKAAEDGAEGTVTAYVAVFGNVDLHGDRIVVKRSDHRVRFLHPRGWNYYATLRHKLHWNEGVVPGDGGH